MKQRVAVARAFASRADALLMDEPFGALDSLTRMALQRELLEQWEQEHKTVVFVTHDIDEAILLSDRILVLSEAPGRVRDEVRVGISRPRDLGVVLAEEFVEIKSRILDQLGVGARLPTSAR
jgi:NitT/TauT family transport system ATP-binding protein